MGAKIPFTGADGRAHQVDADRVDEFVDGRTGEPISDADYDESKARLAQNNDHLIPEEFR